MASEYLYSNGPVVLPAHSRGEVDGHPILRRHSRRRGWVYAVCDQIDEDGRLFATSTGGVFWVRSKAPQWLLDRIKQKGSTIEE